MQRCACDLTSVLSVAAVHVGPEVGECRTCGTRILTGWKEWPTLNAQERRRYFTDVRRLLLPAGVHLPVPTNHGIARTVVIRASTSTCSATASKRLRPRGLLIRAALRLFPTNNPPHKNVCLILLPPTLA